MTQETTTVTGPDGTQSEIRIGQLAVRFLVDGPASGASVTIFELTVPPSAKVPLPTATTPSTRPLWP